MKIDEIAELIQRKYNFIHKPTDNELKQILSRINKFTTEEEFNELIDKYISNTLCYSYESTDMSNTISLLDQIQAILDNK